MADIVGDKDSEYNQVEIESINELIENEAADTVPEWKGKKELLAVTTSSNTGREIPKLDPLRAANALKHAGFKCEFDNEDRTFLRKNGKPCTEPHHLILISKYRDFECSVDIMEIIVSLCSHCHNLLHYGRFEDKEPILEKLYEERKEVLSKYRIELTLE